RTKMEEEVSFFMQGVDKAGGEQLVKAMRVELSRLRKLVESKGRKRVPFKMLLVKVEMDKEKGGCLIVLKKSGSGQIRAMQILDELLPDLAFEDNNHG